MADKYINADKLKENIKAEQKNNTNMGMSVICDWFIEAINNEPAADVQPISHGRWENEYLDDDDVWWADCTNCNNDAHSRFGKVSIYAYCPNCGARMDGDTNG